MTGRGKPMATFIVTSVALFMSQLDNLVVTMALPAIKSHLHASLTSLEWTVNAYTLTFAVLLLPGATLGDRFGRKKMFMIGLSIFTTASALAALSSTANELVAARALQGVGGAIITPLTLDPAQRRRSAGQARARARRVGCDRRPGDRGRPGRRRRHRRRCVMVVDLLAERADRHRLAARRLAVAEGKPRAVVAKLDVVGTGLATAGLFAVVLGLVKAPTGAGGARSIVELFVVGAVFLAAFVMWERRAAEPVLPLRLFRNRGFTASNVASLFMFFGMFGSIFLLAQFLQVAHHYSPLSAGVRTLPWTAMPIFIAPVAGLLSDRIGGRRIVATGSVPSGHRAVLAGQRGDARPSRTRTSCQAWRSADSAWRCSSLRSPTWCSRRCSTRSRASRPVRTTRFASSAACSASPCSPPCSRTHGGYQSAQAFTDGVVPAVKFGALIVALGGVVVAADPAPADQHGRLHRRTGHRARADCGVVDAPSRSRGRHRAVGFGGAHSTIRGRPLVVVGRPHDDPARRSGHESRVGRRRSRSHRCGEPAPTPPALRCSCSAAAATWWSPTPGSTASSCEWRIAASRSSKPASRSSCTSQPARVWDDVVHGVACQRARRT